MLAIFFLILSVSFQAKANLGDLFQTNQVESRTSGKEGGTLKQMSKMCQDAMNSPLLPLLEFYSPSLWPAVLAVQPFVGLAVGAMSRESVFYEICKLAIEIDRNGFGAMAFQTGMLLNNLTGNKFDEEYSLLNDLHSMSMSVYDFQKGNHKVNLANASTHRNLLRIADRVAKYHNVKESEGENRDGIETVAHRRNKINKIAQLAQQRAVLENVSNCPKVADDKDGQKMYTNFITPREAAISRADRDISYYHNKLVHMGANFIQDIGRLTIYNELVREMAFFSMSYPVREERYEANKMVITDKRDKDGKPIRKEQKERRLVNTYSYRMHQELFNEFKTSYSAAWNDYVTAQVAANQTHGVLDGPRGRIEAQYKEFAFECSEVRIVEQLEIKDRNNPMFNKRFKEEQDDCRENLRFQNGAFANLMEEYIQRLQVSLTNKARALTDIWNFEAREMGINRVISEQKDSSSGKIVFEESCSETFSYAELKELSMRKQEVANQLTESWATSEMERQERRFQKLKTEYENEKARKEAVEKEDNLRKNTEGSPAPPISMPSFDGIGL